MKPTPRILTIDDNPHDRELIRESIRAAELDCEVVEVRTRAELDAHIERGDFEMVLADLNFGGTSGLEILDRIAATHPGIPVIIVTGTGTEDTAVEAMKRGAADYVVKSAARLRVLPAILRRTLEHRLERARRVRTERDRDALYRAALAMLVTADTTGRVRSINPAVERVMGWTLDALGDTPLVDLAHPADRHAVAAQFERLAAGETIQESQSRVRDPQGSYRTLVWNAVPIEQTVYISAIDITDSLHSLTRLRQLEAAIDQAHEGVALIDLDGRLVYRNATFQALADASTPPLEEEIRNILFAEHGALHRAVWNRLEARQLWADRLTTSLADEARDLDVAMSAVVDSEGTMQQIAMLVRDVTEHLRLETQYRQAQKMEALGQLAGGVAHDFNNLLQAITGFTRFAMDAEVPATVQSDLDQVMAAADRGVDLVRQLLLFSRQEMTQRRSIEVQQVVGDTVGMLERTLGEHYPIVAEIQEDLPRIDGDAGQLQQVLINLLINARDATPGGGTLLLSASLETLSRSDCREFPGARPGRFVRLVVEDTGEGMTAQVQSRVFEPFFTTKEPGRGTGLGLATVFGIVKQHEGFITVDSSPGRGTRVAVFLPIHEEGPSGRPESETGSEAPTGAETVLLAEDNELVRSFARRVLEGAGYRVLVASDGRDALGLVEARGAEIELALLDVVMPHANGRVVSDALQATNPRAAILFATGYSMGLLDESLLPAVRFPVIRKPYQVEDLLRAVRGALDANG